MSIEEFTEKWLVMYSDSENIDQIENLMKNDLKELLIDFADQVTRRDFYVEFESFEDCFDKKFKL